MSYVKPSQICVKLYNKQIILVLCFLNSANLIRIIICVWIFNHLLMYTLYDDYVYIYNIIYNTKWLINDKSTGYYDLIKRLKYYLQTHIFIKRTYSNIINVIKSHIFHQ